MSNTQIVPNTSVVQQDKFDLASLYDAVIIGGGPAGLTAALYLARARYRVVVVEKEHFGGQITITNEIVNYPGVFSTSGAELTETMRKQAEAFGAEFLLAEALHVKLEGDIKEVQTSRGTLKCFAVLLATGASPRHLGFKGEEEFKGHGVAYCATCDGEFFTGKEVFVVGGGFAAAEESVFLTKYARHVTILVREEDFTCAPATAEGAKKNEKIDILFNTEVQEVSGDVGLSRIVYKNTKTGEVTEYKAEPNESFGVFVFVGYAPATELIDGLADKDPHGYILTDEHQQSSVDGLFAAGDVCVKPLRQVATAIGQAATTATEMERYLKAAQERTGLVPKMNITRSTTATHESQAAIASASGNGSNSAASAAHPKATQSSDTLFDDAMLAQLNAVFNRMATPLILRMHLDDRSVSDDLKNYMQELAKVTDKLSCELASDAKNIDSSAADSVTKALPYVEVCRADGSSSGLEFHGVPGGHEFTSFVLGLYNVSGPGQSIDDADRAAIKALDKPVDLRVLVGLSCTMCPEVVVAAQRIAAENPQVTAQVFDINHFGELKDKYNVMSVPCLVVTDRDGNEKVSFGKKSLAQVLDLINS